MLCVCSFADNAKNDSRTYIAQVDLILRKQWHPKPSRAPVKITLCWTVDKNGQISAVKVLHPGCEPEQAQLAIDALKRASPLPTPPGSASTFDLQFTFETPRMEPPLGLTVNQAMQRFGPSARAALKKRFAQAGIAYPPAKITMIALKQERVVYLFAENKSPVLIGTYPLSTFSGKLGPKLRQGDLQIPEGVYEINGRAASFRLALKVKYPNDFDLSMAAHDKRTALGSDILVHNGTVSTGCLVLSMPDMQELFIAAIDVGLSNVTLIIVPCNLLKSSPDIDFSRQPAWVPQLYQSLKEKLERYPLR
ncbi:MAG: TonB C-terminal domain-containing protein [Candidatus Obscuribacterales bacterium]|nr:TonB C-terminal domain-containing protein [Candidatus Obscuribacterales bacterium]